MSAPPKRQYSRFIVAPDTWPTTREVCEAKAAAWQQAAEASSSAADTHRTAINSLRADGVAQSTTGFEAMHAAYWRNQVKADDLADTRSAAAVLMRNVAQIQKEAEQRIDSIDAEAHRQLASAPLHSPMAIGIISSAAGLVRSSATDAATSITALSGNFAAQFGPPESPVRDPGSDQADGGERPSPPAKSPGEGTDDDFGGSGRPDLPRGQTGVGETAETGKGASSTSFGGERPTAVPPAATATPVAPAAPTPPTMHSPGGVPGFGGGGVSAGSSPLSAGGGVGGLGGMSSGLGGGVSPAGSAGSATASGTTSPAAAFSRALPVVPPSTSFASGAAASSAATPAPPSTAPAAPLMAGLASSGGVSHVPPIAAASNVAAPQPISGAFGTSASAPAQAVGASGLLPPGPMGPPPAAAAVPTASAGSPPRRPRWLLLQPRWRPRQLWRRR